MREYKLIHGDCVTEMSKLPANSVDAIVCDPPYELGFMGKSWDASGIAYSVEMWREALRVLKPGGHLLAFSGSRTYHRMTCAIEDAGFEVRDQIMWVYGSGFPKSLDVSKAIDKARVEDIEPVRVVWRAIRTAMDADGLKSKDLAPHFDNCHPRLIDHWAARDTDSQPSLPTMAQWRKLRELLALGGTYDSEVARLNGRKGEAGDAYQNAEVLGEHTGKTPGFVGERFGVVDNSIRARSDAARQWEGWGTALKPAHEPICVARKPLVGTVAANVLAHGTGALNIDGCRVPHGDQLRAGTGGMPRHDEKTPRGREGEASAERRYTENGGTNFAAAPGPRGGDAAGRWPANLIHDGSDEVLAAFPDAKGQQGITAARSQGDVYGAVNASHIGVETRNDTGSAARFFYCAKASKSDRGDNTHPTVKPTELMAYLVRLVTPPGGVVLDPFMGSGSTGKAAMCEGFRFIGIELDAGYLEIARARIAAELSVPKQGVLL